MSHTLTVDGPCRRTIRFEIDRAVVDAQVAAELNRIAQGAAFKGFRKGKVPLAMVEKLHGRSVRDEVRHRLMSEAYREAVEQHGLHPLGDPELNLEPLADEADAPFTFELSLEVAPDFELAALESIPVTVTLPELDERFVDGEVERIRREQGGVEDAPADAVAGKDDTLVGTVTYVVGGQELEPRPERPIVPARDMLDGVVVPGSGEAFLGKAAGDVVEIPLELPGHFEPTVHAGRAATARVALTAVRRPRPAELDEALLAKLGIASEEALRAAIRAQIQGYRDLLRTQQVDRALETHIVQAHPLELPERMKARAIDARVHRIAHQLMEQQGLDADTGHRRAEDERPRVAEMVERSLIVSFVLSRIAREHALAATGQEVRAQVRSLAQSQGEDADKLLESALREGWLGEIAGQITEQKAREWLRSRAVVTEAAPAASDEEGATEP